MRNLRYCFLNFFSSLIFFIAGKVNFETKVKVKKKQNSKLINQIIYDLGFLLPRNITSYK